MDRRIRQSRRQEQQQAAALSGSRTIASGSQWIQKNDVRTAEWSIEYKFTDKKSFSLKLAELKQAERIALLDGREMAFGIRMGGEDWIVMSFDTFKSLVDAHGDASADSGTGLGG